MGNSSSSSNKESNTNNNTSSSGGQDKKRSSITSAHDKKRSSISSASSAVSKMLRSPSGADIHDTAASNFAPIEKLTKMLIAKTQNEFGVNGIMAETFSRHVFPHYTDLGLRLFNYLHSMSRAKTVHMGGIAFRQQCERFLGMLDDAIILETYVRMYCGDPEKPDLVTPEGLKSLLASCFKLVMAHYSEGNKTCPLLERTLDTVADSCFFSKDSLSAGFVCRWLESNCSRLVPPMHKYCVHILTSAYRGLESSEVGLGLELSTPILEKTNPFPTETNPPLMPLSEAWLLAGALPILYSKPQPIQSPTNSGTNLASHVFMAKLLSVVPSHWSLLYDSDQHGVGSNRFLHHVLGYKGPTLILLKVDNGQVFCIASPAEWRETHLYTGAENSAVLQLQPKFALIEKGQKILYLNTITRGYPKGLRAGGDPRKPIIAVDEYFEKIDIRGSGHNLLSIEVWGCGDKHSRDVQLDIKKWQVKEAERQRTVKLSANDWMDHPDRYLLELGGRPQYNN